MIKKFIASHQKIISGALLTLVIVGSLASLVAIAYPFLGLAAWKFVDGAPDAPNLVYDFVKVLISTLPGVPAALFLGGAAAFVYTFAIDDPENKVFLRVWSVVLLAILIMFMYPYIHTYLR